MWAAGRLYGLLQGGAKFSTGMERINKGEFKRHL